MAGFLYCRVCFPAAHRAARVEPERDRQFYNLYIRRFDTTPEVVQACLSELSNNNAVYGRSQEGEQLQLN